MSSKSKPSEAPRQARLKLNGQKEFVVDDQGGLLSCFGGLPVLARLEQHENLIKRAADLIPDWRKQPERAEYGIEELVLQRECLVTCGLPDGVDCSQFSRDPAILAVLKKDPETGRAASKTTQHRLEKNISAETMKELEAVFLDHFFEQHAYNMRELAIIGDSSAIRTYGSQQGAMTRGGKYAGKPIFYPLIFTSDSGWLLHQELRMGKESDANAGPAIRDLTNKIQEHYPGIRLRLTLDTGFNDPELLQYLDAAGIEYEIGFPFTAALKRKCADAIAEAKAEFTRKFGRAKFVGKKAKEKWQKEHTRIKEMSKDKRTEAEAKRAARRVRRVIEESHLASKWDYDRRVVIRIEYSDDGLDVRCVVTSSKAGLPRTIYEEKYCKRSRIEPWIFQMKGQCRVPLSCQEFTANQFRFFLQGLGYQLLQLLRRFLPGIKSSWSMATVRSRLLLIPVLIEPTARLIRWHLSSAADHLREFFQLIQKLERLA